MVDKELVSIIVPIYNVSNYLDNCLTMLCNQTYKKIEIVLVDDGSTDDSSIKCDEWKKKDARIIVCHKKNEGQGHARNDGIRMAKGYYVMFMDPDDEVRKDFVEKMFKAVSENDSDMAECDHEKIDLKSGVKSYMSNTGCVGKFYSKEERLICGGRTAVWKTITKRSMWLDNDLLMEYSPSEDIGIYPLMLFLSSKIVNVREPLYLYNRFQSTSTSGGLLSTMMISLAIKEMLEEMKKKNLFEVNRNVLLQYSLRSFSREINSFVSKEGSDEVIVAEKMYLAVVRDYFSGFDDKFVFCFGSYNLSKIATKMQILERPYNRCHFSSLISMTSSSPEITIPKHSNQYRQWMIQQDIKKTYLDKLKTKKEKYLFLDFIEERFDIIEINNCYITNSDALQEASSEIQGRIIKRTSEECTKIWKESCKKFIGFLKNQFKPNHVILVKNYLSLSYGSVNKKRYYEDQNYLIEINQVLKEYYDFFERNYAGIHVIDCSEDELYFTDEKYEYGCYPWHLNELVNVKIAKEINLCERGLACAHRKT